jgi:uncharacterized damage-inducible protein DinB
MMDDAFRHHVWATLRLIDVCRALSSEQLDDTCQGTYGSILQTFRHLVGADSFYLTILGVSDVPLVDEDTADLLELRGLMEQLGTVWATFLSHDLKPDEVIEEHEENGYERRAPVSIRLAQALDHGSDHRSQICTMLTSLGVEAPVIDVWEYGIVVGRIFEEIPTGESS